MPSPVSSRMLPLVNVLVAMKNVGCETAPGGKSSSLVPNSVSLGAVLQAEGRKFQRAHSQRQAQRAPNAVVVFQAHVLQIEDPHGDLLVVHENREGLGRVIDREHG